MQKLKSKNRDFVEKYLAAPSHRAVARSTTSDYLHMSWGFATIELARARIDGPAPWAPGIKDHLIRIPIAMVTGRWLGPRDHQGTDHRSFTEAGA